MKDMMILYGTEAYKRASSEYKDINSEEAKALLKQRQEEGMIRAFFACMRSKGWVFAICGCDREICFPFRAHKVAGGVFHPGPDTVALDQSKCIGCGTCVERCPFSANALVEGSSILNLALCYGCGLCVSTCKGPAREMVQRASYRPRYYPMELVNKAAA